MKTKEILDINAKPYLVHQQAPKQAYFGAPGRRVGSSQ